MALVEIRTSPLATQVEPVLGDQEAAPTQCGVVDAFSPCVLGFGGEASPQPAAQLERSGVPAAAQEYYFKRLHHIVLPNVRRLQDAFRDLNLEVIHTRIQSLTKDGRDRSVGHRRLGLHAAPGSKEAEFLPEVAPKGDEIIINKTASGVFNATNLEYILRNLNITGLFVTGVYTNECVSTAIRDACDLGFYVTLIEDGCATVTEELQNATIRTVKDRYARVLSTQEAIKEIRAVVDE